METPYNLKFRLVGLSLGVILALLIWPATRRIVWSELSLVVPTAASSAPWSSVAPLGGVGASNRQNAFKMANDRSRTTAERHPDDFPLQFAVAVAVPPADGSLTSDLKVRRLRALAERFPERPTLTAAILRFATLTQVRAERDEEASLTGEPVGRAQANDNKIRNTREQLAAFDQDAALGERLDPENAYFPFLRAIGLFAAHRDAEALAAIERAAQKPNWTEYYNDEVDAEWRLQEGTFGTVSALPRLAYAAGVLFPHYSQLRVTSRIAIVKAVEAEQAGHIEEGLRIRTAVRKCGGLMRVQSVCVLGALVGISISQTALLRPGGEALIPPVLNASETQTRYQRGLAFDAYLRRIGHSEEIAAVDAETAAGVQARAIARSASHSPAFQDPWNVALFWVAALLLLSNALWMLVLGGGGTLLTYHQRIRAGLGLPPATRAGVALGLAAGPLAAGAALMRPAMFVSALMVGGILLGSLLLLALPGAQGAGRLHRLGAFWLTLLGAALVCSTFLWQVGGSVGPAMQFLTLMQDTETTHRAFSLSLVTVAIATAVPLLTLLTLSLLSRIWGVPLSVGVARGLRGCAVPIACVLLLAYSLLVPLTLHQESALEARMQRTVQHEGRFMAEMIGKQWPGATP